MSRNRSAVAIACVTVLAYAWVLLAIGPPLDALSVVLVQLAFMAPGLAIVARVLPAGARWLTMVAMGPPVGLAVSGLSLLALWAVGARGSWLFVAAPTIALGLAWPAPALRGRWRS